MKAHVSGKEIKRLRDRKAWTQERLAEVAGISIRTVQRAAEGTFSAETLCAIAAAFEIEVESLSAAMEGQPPTISPVVYYDDPASLDWLCEAFGFSIAMRIPGPDGRILHAELVMGGGRILIGQPMPSRQWTTPQLAGVHTMSLYVGVEDVDEHCQRAKATGAEILAEPEDVHGQRRYLCADPEGHHWWFFTAGGAQ